MPASIFKEERGGPCGRREGGRGGQEVRAIRGEAKASACLVDQNPLGVDSE